MLFHGVFQKHLWNFLNNPTEISSEILSRVPSISRLIMSGVPTKNPTINYCKGSPGILSVTSGEIFLDIFFSEVAEIAQKIQKDFLKKKILM